MADESVPPSSPEGRTVEERTAEGLSADARFKSYVDLYCHLDRTLWQAVGFLGLVATFGVKFVADAAANPELRLFPFDHRSTLSVIYFVVGGMFFLGVRSMYRLYAHHGKLDTYLDSIDPNGYWHWRAQQRTAPWRSATLMYKLFFLAVGAVLVGTGVVNLIAT